MRFDHDENAQLEMVARRKVDFEREARAKLGTCPPCNHNCNEGRTCPARVDPETDLAMTPSDWVGMAEGFLFAVLIVSAMVLVPLAIYFRGVPWR